MSSPRPEEPRFPPGSRVRVAEWTPPVHHRVPWFVKGLTGTVERVCGGFQEPELAAIYRTGPDRPIYRVRIAQRDIWADYDGPPGDTLEIEIFEHWLTAA